MEPRNKIGSLSPAERLVGFEPGTFQFYHNVLTHLATFPQFIFLRANEQPGGELYLGGSRKLQVYAHAEYIFPILQYLLSSQDSTHFFPLSEVLIYINRTIKQENYLEKIGKNIFHMNHTLVERKSKSILFPVLNSKGQEWEVGSNKIR